MLLLLDMIILLLRLGPILQYKFQKACILHRRENKSVDVVLFVMMRHIHNSFQKFRIIRPGIVVLALFVTVLPFSSRIRKQNGHPN